MPRRLPLLTLMILAVSIRAVAAAPSNDAFNRALTVRTLPFVTTQDTTYATTAFGDPQCVGQGPTVWFKYRADADGWIEANTIGSGYDTTLSVYYAAAGRTLAQVACNDDSDGLQSRLRFHAAAGVTYYVMAGAYGSGPGGALTIAMDVSADQTNLALDLRITSAVLDPATGVVTMRGTVSCSRPQTGFVAGQIIQKRGNREVAGFFGAEVLCNGSGTWMAISNRPQAIQGSGSRAAVFAAGRAIATGRVWLWDENTGSINEGQTTTILRLN
jgi:hypothetical protein